MKVLVTGARGQLGHDIIRELVMRGHETIGSDIHADCGNEGSVLPADAFSYLQLDITDKEKAGQLICTLQPDAVIHCAAWTDVDGAEKPENREKVRLINTEGTRNIAEAAKASGSKMMYISTDYVFGGDGDSPRDPDDRCFGPVNVYGQTKLDGEAAVIHALKAFFIVRTSWMFGLTGNNFVKTMIKAGKTHETVRVVSDQVGTPTYTKDLARLLADMAETEKFGIYHASNEGGYISWYEFCREIYRRYGLKTKILPVTTEEYGLSAAARPLNSRLDKRKLTKAGFKLLPPWQDAVRRYLTEADL